MRYLRDGHGQTCFYGDDDKLGQILTRLKKEPKNFFYSCCKIRPRSWVVLASSRVKNDAGINLITALANTRIVGDAGIARSSGSDSEDTTRISREINKAMEITKAMDLRATLRAQRKKCKTDARAVNVVVSSEEETGNGRLEFRRKRRPDCTRLSVVTATTSVSPLASSKTLARESSPIATRGISPPLQPPVQELSTEDSGELAPSHQNLSTGKL